MITNRNKGGVSLNHFFVLVVHQKKNDDGCNKISILDGILKTVRILCEELSQRYITIDTFYTVDYTYCKDPNVVPPCIQ
jgi:hypothetical protein